MKSYHIVINPAGASGRTNQCWAQIKAELEKLRISYQVHLSNLEYGITDIMHDLTSSEEDVYIILIGGDGSMNLAVNGIVNFAKTHLGLIPCGSGNDLAKALGIKGTAIDSLHRILYEESTRDMDVGLLTYHSRFDGYGNAVSNEAYSRRYNISSGIGYDAAISKQVQVSAWKKILNALHIGKLIYLFVGARLIFLHNHFKTTIQIDQQSFNYRKLLFIATMNTAYEGGGFKFCPDADPSDRKLDICIADGLGRIDFFRIFPYARKGVHHRFKGVYLKRGSSIHIQTEKPVWVHTDGEVEYMSDSVSYSILPEKLHFLG